MKNFEYKNPVKIIFGKGTIPKVAGEIPENSRVLMIYGGGSIKRNGVYDQVKNALKNFELFEFGGIEANPHYETCIKAMEVVKANNIDFLLSVGGGSVIDATKFIAAGALYEGEDPWDFFTQRFVIEPKAAIPLGAVLTLPATGSEMNWNSVVSRVSTQEKLAFGSPLVMPQFSVLDPECVFSLPDRQVANGVVDAFVHVMEQYLTYPVNSPLQDRFAEGILHTLIEEGPKVLANRNDYDSAANFMWSATMALNGLIALGVPSDWATHMIGHELTAFHGIDHARTLAIVLPGMMNIKRHNKKDKILQYGERIWGINQGTDDERIDKTIDKTVAFFKSLGVPCTLPEYDVPAETIQKIKERFKTRGSKLGENADIDYNQVEEILTDRL
ncbi:NADP-dependent alcohol dehydrogenase [Mariniphaga anaerophila]|uniref:NADP-dependent alcohol dehydrogenase n=1 Tax=Mariniphaga anaerophila TaxID=1484053 RepID=A0A1M4XN46_9BACT|nr:iron-containing alcohol dehydrogenase [Mariniphaga anaerophila]SHE94895.1 NADP-dependent alcohol dehydrogenase [Mariniphaga anaerophila]